MSAFQKLKSCEKKIKNFEINFRNNLEKKQLKKFNVWGKSPKILD